MSASLRIEAFDRSRHKRDLFESGIDAVDQYFRKTAGKLSKAGNVSFFVMVDTAAPETVIGYYTLNAHAVHFGALPPKYKRTAPGHGQIPAAFISMMGIDATRQGEGLGALVLADALKRVLRASETVATAVVVLDVLACGNLELMAKRFKFYKNFGFQPLQSHPNRLYLSVASIRASLV